VPSKNKSAFIAGCRSRYFFAYTTWVIWEATTV
jgi:hypothetical protein